MTRLPYIYKCALCGGTLQTDWSDAEANEEFEKAFGRKVCESDEVVCDDCYTKMMGG